MSSDYRALILDLDGTLVADNGAIHPRTREALQRIHDRGVPVMIATGRSETAAQPALEELGFDVPSVLYNGAAVYCPVEKRVIEQVCLGTDDLDEVIAYGEREGCLIVAMADGEKVGYSPPDIDASLELHDMTRVRFVSSTSDLRIDEIIRVSLFSKSHQQAGAFAAHFESSVQGDYYVTDFRLSLLPSHRESKLTVLDVHPPCPGKARALELLEERFGVPPEQVVAIGDATNDLPMIERAGLGVAMQISMPEVIVAADRVIGASETDTIADLVEELFE